LSGGSASASPWAAPSFATPRFSVDEPLSNLDRQASGPDRIEIKKVHQKVRTTTVYVTHGPGRSNDASDRVVVMNHGRIEQIERQRALPQPATRFVAGFIGSPRMNFVPCRLEDVAGKLQSG